MDPNYRYITGRFPDGDVVGTIVFIQFHESHHYLDKETMKIENKKTKQQTLDLTSNKDIGPKIVFSISEKDWKERKEWVIEQFKLLMEEVELMKK